MTYQLEDQREALSVIRQWAHLGDGQKVAVLDGGIDRHNPDLTGAKVHSADISVPTLHGTAVATIIAGQQTGIAPQSEIIEIPVFEEDAHGTLKGCSQFKLATAIRESLALGADVINISGANLSNTGLPNDEIRNAVAKCAEKNVQLVAAVGNDGLQVDTIPANVEAVLAIGAHDMHGKIAAFNNLGAGLKHKTIFAPGVDIFFKDAQGEARISGSSFAAPLVSGLCALIRSIAPHLSLSELQELIFQSCVPSTLSHQGDNKSNAARRLDLVLLRENLGPFRAENVTPQSHFSERNFPMSDNDLHSDTVVPAGDIEPAIADTIEPAEALVEPAQSPNEATPATIEPAAAAFLEHPTPAAGAHIPDPAAHTFVHAPQMQDTVRPQHFGSNILADEKVFVNGTIGYDFVNETNRDYFQQAMFSTAEQFPHLKPLVPENEISMARFLALRDASGNQPNMDKSTALVWTLKVDGIPIYAIRPQSQFAMFEFSRLLDYLIAQTGVDANQIHDEDVDTGRMMTDRLDDVDSEQKVDRVSIAGKIVGETRLYNGHVVPTISPILRGMFAWNPAVLANAALGASPKKSEKEALRNFLERIYYDLRNRGHEPHERALNFAATNAYQAAEVFKDAISRQMELDGISVERSPVSRPGSDFWDVILSFFDPENKDQRARRLYRYTIDVSGLMPVTFGPMRSWSAF